jgi:hypothetical protein
METKTTELRGTDAMRAMFLIDAARHGKLKVTPDIYGFKVKHRALLVEPLNANPFILIDETAETTPDLVSLPRVTRMEFVAEPKSGTDFLRARMKAGLFFDDLPDAPLSVPSNAELVIESLQKAKPKRGPCQMHDQASTEQLERDSFAAPGL